MPQPAIGTAIPWSLPASLGLHLALLAAIILFPVTRHLATPELHAIAVQILTRQQFRTATQPPPTSEPAPAPVATPSPIATPATPSIPELPAGSAAPPVPDDGMVHSTHLYAADILTDPANAEIRDTLPLLAIDERIVQLCNIEGLEQIREWKPALNPDELIAYAFAETTIADTTLKAEGAAFHTGADWLALRFECTVAADFQSVENFQFAVGEPIPKDQWNEHNLPSGEGAQD